MADFLAPIDEDVPELTPRGNGGGQMMPTETKIGDVVSMRRAAVLMPRQPAEVRRLLAEMAEMFGDSWEYRFPVKNKRTGQTEFIEGPTIGCTMAVARAYGNCDVAHTRTEDEGNGWVLYSTFVDLQSGFSLTRGFRQRKGQSRMGGDRERGEDIDFQIGVSKSTRNVVARALDDFVQYARQRARDRMASQIAKRPDEYKERIRRYLDEVAYPLSAVEGAVGSKIAAWSPEQVATVVRTLTAHKDRILTDLDEVYRPRAAAEEAMPQARHEPATASAPEPGTGTAAEAAPPDGGQQRQAGEPSRLRTGLDDGPPLKRKPGRPSRAEVEARQRVQEPPQQPRHELEAMAQERTARNIIAEINTASPEDVDGVLQTFEEEIAALSDELRTEVVAAAHDRMALIDDGDLDDGLPPDLDPGPDPLDAEGKPPVGETSDDDGFDAWRADMEAKVAGMPWDMRKMPARKNIWLAEAERAGWGERGTQAVEEAFAR